MRLITCRRVIGEEFLPPVDDCARRTMLRSVIVIRARPHPRDEACLLLADIVTD
jgi:hypothetical protein